MAFDMPPHVPGADDFDIRGAWLIAHLMIDLAPLADFQGGSIVGNLGWESAGLAVYHEIGLPEAEGGIGWAQWTGPRRRQFEDWCAAHSLASRSNQANYGFLLDEFRGAYLGILDNLRRTTLLRDAVSYIEDRYEAPARPWQSFRGRLAYAERALAAHRKAK